MSEWTKEREDEIRARCEAATDGPWIRYSHRTGIVLGCGGASAICNARNSTQDASFIANSRQDLPDSLAELDRRAEALTTEHNLGYRKGYSNGHYDATEGEEFSDSPGDSAEIERTTEAAYLEEIAALRTQVQRALRVVNRYRGVISGRQSAHPDEVVAEFCAETEKDYADVFKAADEERTRWRRRGIPYLMPGRKTDA